MSKKGFNLYILRCADGTLYTGIARDVDDRMREHESGVRGAKYLRGRAPFKLVFEQAAGNRSRAQRLEHRVKRLRRADKQALVDGRIDLQALDTVDA